MLSVLFPLFVGMEARENGLKLSLTASRTTSVEDNATNRSMEWNNAVNTLIMNTMRMASVQWNSIGSCCNLV